jgi:MarR family transcriptional regulator, organic hydroperoxide resistance regulator
MYHNWFTRVPIMDRRIIFMLNRAQRALSGYASSNLDALLGISVAHLTTLMYVSKHAGCSMTELADLLDLNKSAVTGLVQRMERGGTLRREANPEDGRGSLLYVTAKGDALRERAKPLVRRLNGELAEGFTDAEIEVVLRFLNRTVERFVADGKKESS